MKLKGQLTLGLAACIVLLGPAYARAATCAGTVTLPATCAGTLDAESGTPGSVVVAPFTLSTTSAVAIYTTSYGGGANLDSTTTGPGGFQPSLTLFDTTGFALAYENGTFSPIANADPSNGWKGDGYIQGSNVPAGSYYAILTDVNNQVAASFSGFGNTAPSQFYTLFSGPGGASFTDVQGNSRSGSYALDIQATPLSTAAVPEPATFALMFPALLIAALLWKRHGLSLS